MRPYWPKIVSLTQKTRIIIEFGVNVLIALKGHSF